MTNSGLLPATGGISTSVYTENAFPYSMANLFRQAGYTARSFHNSDGQVYDRGLIHPNLAMRSTMGATTCRWRATSWTAISSTALTR